MKSKQMSVGNLIFKLDTEDSTGLELLTVFEKWFYPNLVNLDYAPNEDTHYVIENGTLTSFGGQPAFIGRFGSKKVFEKQQDFKNKKFVADRLRVHDYPTSFFVLFLSNHRFLWLPETKNAPTYRDFEKALEKVFEQVAMNTKSELLTDVSEDDYDKRRRIHRTKFYVKIEPLTDLDSIEEAFKSIKQVRRLDYRVMRTNADRLEDEDEFDEKINTVLKAKQLESEISGAQSVESTLTLKKHPKKDASLDVEYVEAFLKKASSGLVSGEAKVVYHNGQHGFFRTEEAVAQIQVPFKGDVLPSLQSACRTMYEAFINSPVFKQFKWMDEKQKEALAVYERLKQSDPTEME